MSGYIVPKRKHTDRGESLRFTFHQLGFLGRHRERFSDPELQSAMGSAHVLWLPTLVLQVLNSNLRPAPNPPHSSSNRLRYRLVVLVSWFYVARRPLDRGTRTAELYALDRSNGELRNLHVHVQWCIRLHLYEFTASYRMPV